MSRIPLKKISVKTTFGTIAMVKDHIDIPILRIMGTAKSIEVGESTYGEYKGIKGKFLATNHVTGEDYEATMCYLPDAATNLIEETLLGEDIDAVEFAFDIIPQGDESSSTGYSYLVVPLVEPAEDDPLEKMRSKLPPPKPLKKPPLKGPQKAPEKIAQKSSKKQANKEDLLEPEK
jgi:hypothetical protein